ncbi:hypothetical protein PsorP6_002032 [Peronosclerospora sorghi]|uniref:Uncharacterized protein n=1 Tax=Peronosclerospora sorghi TaxID=230839 RepID=A0ACC0X046_9STRA|nr:hypothetical protein PsorP6_002032 [Peronosclerospora sorghi]
MPATAATTSTSPPTPGTSRTPGNSVLTRPGRKNPTEKPEVQRPGSYIPPESLLKALEETISKYGTAADLRTIALREVQRARVPALSKLKFISGCLDVLSRSYIRSCKAGISRLIPGMVHCNVPDLTLEPAAGYTRDPVPYLPSSRK